MLDGALHDFTVVLNVDHALFFAEAKSFFADFIEELKADQAFFTLALTSDMLDPAYALERAEARAL